MKKKYSPDEADDIRPEYDLRSLKLLATGPGRKISAETNRKMLENRRALGYGIVVLDPDVAIKFPSSKTVNDTLRAVSELISLQKKHSARKTA